jgi:hypothetical protein
MVTIPSLHLLSRCQWWKRKPNALRSQMSPILELQTRLTFSLDSLMVASFSVAF